MAAELPVLDYGRPARPRWLPRLLRTLIIILIIAGGAALGGVIGDRLQPDPYIFNGSLSVSSSDAGTDVAAAKQAHIIAIRGGIPAAATHSQGPAVERTGRGVWREVPLAQRHCVVAVLFERLGDGRRALGNVAEISGEAGGRLSDRRETNGVMIATGEQRATGRRTKCRRVDVTI